MSPLILFKGHTFRCLLLSGFTVIHLVLNARNFSHRQDCCDRSHGQLREVQLTDSFLQFSEIIHSLAFFCALSLSYVVDPTTSTNSLMMEHKGINIITDMYRRVREQKKMRSEAHTADYNYNNLKFSADVTVHRGCSSSKKKEEQKRATRRLNE